MDKYTCEPKQSRAPCNSWFGIALMLAATSIFAQDVAVVERYPTGSIRTNESADAALADIAKERSSVETRYTQEVQSCHSRFFATSCIEDAQERRRQALRPLRSIEVEANEFKRRERVIQRDKALADKRAKDLEKRRERGASRNVPVKAGIEQPRGEAASEKTGGAARKNNEGKSSDRQARHEARLKSIREKEAAEAGVRSQNVAAYERKMREARERQLELERRRAEKEQKRRAQPAESANAQ